MSRLDNQYFTYRQNPVDYDGTGTIESLKGSTLVWNQLVNNGNFADTSVWQNYNSTFTVSGNTATVKTTNASNQFGIYQPITFKANHKYFVSFEVEKQGTITLKRNRLSSGQEQIQEGLYRTIETASADYTTSSPIRILFGEPVSDITNDYFMVKNYMIIDLTQMGLDITDPSEFASLFSLPYYAYNQGSLLSFSGNGIKTVGKNIVSSFVSNLNIAQYGTALQCEADIKPNTTYTISFVGQNGLAIYPNENLFTTHSWVTMNGQRQFVTLTTKSELPSTQKDSNGWYIFKKGNGPAIAFTTPFEDVQIELGSSASSYEPYTSSTLSLPISTYFPNGMKSAGSVYDELTESKAITRLKKVTYSNSTGWSMRTTESGWNLFEITPSDIKHVGTPPNETIKNNRFNWNRGLTDNNTIRQVNTTITVRKDDITSLADWGTYLASNPLEVIYELATPLENYGVVDLGSLTWTYSTQGFFLATINDVVQGMSSSTVNPNVVSDMYVYKGASGWTSMPNMSYGFNNTEIRIKNTAYSTADAFKYNMEGVYLLYEKQSPSPVDLDLTYNIYKDGTEQLYPYITIDLGDLDWTAEGSGLGGDYEMTSRSVPFGIDIPSMFNKADISCSAYSTHPYVEVNTGTTGISVNEDGKIVVYDPNYNQFGSASAFKTAMSGVKLTYRIFTTPFYGDIYYRGLIPVSVNVYPLGSGTVTGSGQYRYHEDVTLVATPNDIYRFLRYEDENGDTLSTSPTYTFEAGE